MKRKLLCLLLAMTMVLGLTANVFAVEENPVTWTIDDGLLTISGQGPIPDYAEGEAPWMDGEVYSLIIEDGITAIGSNAFRGMPLLMDVTVGQDVGSIDKTAFNDCPKLSDVIFRGDAHIIPAGTFSNCTGLSVFRFAGDLPWLENGSLVTGYKGIMDDIITVQYDKSNETWTEKAAGQFDPVDPIEYYAYQNHLGQEGTCGDDLTWQILLTDVSYMSHYLVISGTGPMYDYEEGEAPWLSYIKDNRLTVRGLYILPGVSYIGKNAFAGLGVSQTGIPGSVREIGAGAYQKNSKLSNPYLQGNIRHVGDYAYAYTGTNYLSFGDPLPELGTGIFKGCESLTDAKLPEGMTHIPEAMFSGCTKLREVTIPTTATAIGTDAFFGCSRLKTVNFHGTTQQWDAIAVADGNDPLLDADLKGVISTGESCGDNALWTLSDDFATLTISGTGAVTSCPWANAADRVKTVIVEEGITSLCNNAFYDFEIVTEIRLPETLTEIGDNAFRNNYSLTHLELPAGLTRLGEYVFTWCSSLQSMVIPEGITEIPSHLLSYCAALESVKMSENVTGIGSDAFHNCTSLSEINIPTGLTKLGGDAFLGCKSLTIPFVWPETLPVVGTALQGSGITEIVLPETVTTIGYYAFSGCANLEEIYIPDSVTSIGDNAFAYTSGLKSVRLPEGITTIPQSCFNSSGITEITLPEGVTTIERYAFNSCYNLERVVLPETVTQIASEVFTHCTSLTGINWPSGVDTIGWGQFRGTGLVEFTVPATVREIQSYAFQNCAKLEKVVFESPETDITGGQVFENDPLLTIYCWNGTDAQEAAEYYMIPYVLFDPPADPPRYPIYATVVCGDGQILVPTESVGYQWVTIDIVPGPDSVLAGLELYYYADMELELRVEPVDEDTIRLLMPRCPVEFVAYFQNTITGFIDIKSSDFFYDPVIWAFDSGITKGISEIEFGPTTDCNRAQVVTFLWRAAGCPEPTVTENPFVDVQAGSFYEKAVLWAVENGITNGADATHFNPGGVCNRAQVVTFLYRAFGNPGLSGAENPFTDVPADTWYTAPVLWAVENGITNGMGSGLFGVDNPCNRAQIVTFLYRAYNN